MGAATYEHIATIDVGESPRRCRQSCAAAYPSEAMEALMHDQGPGARGQEQKRDEAAVRHQRRHPMPASDAPRFASPVVALHHQYP